MFQKKGPIIRGVDYCFWFGATENELKCLENHFETKLSRASFFGSLLIKLFILSTIYTYIFDITIFLLTVAKLFLMNLVIIVAILVA